MEDYIHRVFAVELLGMILPPPSPFSLRTPEMDLQEFVAFGEGLCVQPVIAVVSDADDPLTEGCLPRSGLQSETKILLFNLECPSILHK